MALTLPTAAAATTEYEDFYESTLAAPCTAADTDIFPTTLPASAIGFLVLDPLGTTPEVIFYNVKGANYVRVPSAVDGEGRGVGNTTPRPYAQGTKIGMYSIAEFFEGIVTGRFMRDGFLQSRHFSAGIDPNSWIGTGETWNYVGNNGQKEYQYVTAGDKTAKYTRGMKLRLPRVITVGTQCADMESTSSQFASKAAPGGFAFTDDFTCEAWIKIESYVTLGEIISKWDGTNGFQFDVNATGVLTIRGFNAGVQRNVSSIGGMPIGEWVHVAGTLDMSGWTSATCKLFVNGIDIPALLNQSGAIVALIQAGNLQVGAANSLNFFDGEISDARVWSTVRTQAQIRDNMHKQLVGNEAGLVAYFKLDGNFNDSTANANNLTGSGGAVATTVDNPLKAVEFGILTDMAFSAGNTTMTLWTGNNHNAPYENLTGIAYTSGRNPVGFPGNEDMWTLKYMHASAGAAGATGSAWLGAAASVGTSNIWLPVGAWAVEAELNWTATGIDMNVALSTSTAAPTDNDMVQRFFSNSAIQKIASVWIKKTFNQTAAASLYFIMNPSGATGSQFRDRTNDPQCFTKVRAKCAYL